MFNILKYFVIVLGLGSIALAAWLFYQGTPADTPVSDISVEVERPVTVPIVSELAPKEIIVESLGEDQIAHSQQQDESTKGVVFSGEYQEYNTGCFADGICSIVVDGREVITISGRKPGPVGIFENPDLPFGTLLEVHAKQLQDGTYTLYGSEQYYVKAI